MAKPIGGLPTEGPSPNQNPVRCSYQTITVPTRRFEAYQGLTTQRRSVSSHHRGKNVDMGQTKTPGDRRFESTCFRSPWSTPVCPAPDGRATCRASAHETNLGHGASKASGTKTTWRRGMFISVAPMGPGTPC